METDKITTLVIGITVCVVLATCCLIPMISDYSSTATVTYNNLGGYKMSSTEKDTTVAITTDGTSSTMTVNDVAVDYISTIKMSPIVWNKGLALINQGESKTILLMFIKSDGTRSSTTIDTSLTAVFGEDSIEFTVVNDGVTTTLTSDYSWCFNSDDDGTWAYYFNMSVPDTMYFKSTSDVYFANAPSGQILTVNGDTVTGNNSLTNLSVTYDTEEIQNTDIISMEKGDMIVSYTYNNQDKTDNTEQNCIVPIIVKGTNFVTERYADLINIIPIFVLIGIVLATIGLVMFKRSQ